MNVTAKGRALRDAELAKLRARNAPIDRFGIDLISQNLVDFDDQPPPPPPTICGRCHHAIAAMVGCYCDWGDGEEPSFP